MQSVTMSHCIITFFFFKRENLGCSEDYIKPRAQRERERARAHACNFLFYYQDIQSKHRHHKTKIELVFKCSAFPTYSDIPKCFTILGQKRLLEQWLCQEVQKSAALITHTEPWSLEWELGEPFIMKPKTISLGFRFHCKMGSWGWST